MTEDELVDRIRTVVGALPGLKEGRGLDLRKLTPADSIDGAFTVRFLGGVPVGGMSLTEEVRGIVEVMVGRAVKNDYDRARRIALQDGRTITNAIIKDATTVHGEYVVEDEGRGLEVIDDDGTSYLRTEIRIPVNFEAVIE